MQKVVLVLVIGILMFSASGCGSGEETEEVTSAPDATPAETEPEATEEGADSETEEAELEEFQDPLVEERQEDQAAADAGLIQSTKPEERLLQLRGSDGETTATTAPTTPPTDPFGVLPPLVVQGTPEDEEEMNQSLVADVRQVPELPSLPIAAAPPSWRSEIVVATPAPPSPSTPPGRNGDSRVTPGDTGGSASPTNPPQQPADSGSVARNDPNGSRNQGTPATPRNGTTSPADTDPTIALSPAQIPSLPQLPTPPAQSASPPPVVAMPPAPPETPPLEVATVPALPQLPPSESPQAWLDPNPPQVEEPPPPPSTAIAEAIQVTGVVEGNENTRVILKSPSEPTSRYVAVGQTIANGEVLVKRVKFSPDTDPIVIFEQNGVEIAIEVGSMPVSEEEINILTPPPPSINAFNSI